MLTARYVDYTILTMRKPIATDPMRRILGIRLTEIEQDALYFAAYHEHRTMSGLARMIIRKWLADKGFLEVADD